MVSMNKNNFVAILKVGRYPEIVAFLLTACLTASRTGHVYTGTCLGCVSSKFTVECILAKCRAEHLFQSGFTVTVDTFQWRSQRGDGGMAPQSRKK